MKKPFFIYTYCPCYECDYREYDMPPKCGCCSSWKEYQRYLKKKERDDEDELQIVLSL